MTNTLSIAQDYINGLTDGYYVVSIDDNDLPCAWYGPFRDKLDCKGIARTVRSTTGLNTRTVHTK